MAWVCVLEHAPLTSRYMTGSTAVERRDALCFKALVRLPERRLVDLKTQGMDNTE